MARYIEDDQPEPSPVGGVRDVTDQRPFLVNLAYRLLGSIADAEDVVQDAYCRWLALSDQQRRAIDSPRSWLAKVTGRICLDVLGSARIRRERYVGEWLPEPLPGRLPWSSQSSTTAAADPADQIVLDTSVSMAFLIMLESMTPAERVAFVLHDIFGYPFTEIAEVVGRSVAASRQLATSARRRLRSVPPTTPADKHREAVRAFKVAWEQQNIDALIRLLDPDGLAIIDGGGLVSAALHPIEGAESIASFFLGVLDRQPNLVVSEATVNGQPGLVAHTEAETMAAIAIEVAGGAITQVWAVRNPEKLRLWARPR